MNINYKKFLLGIVVAVLLAIPSIVVFKTYGSKLNIERSKSNQLQLDLLKRNSQLDIIKTEKQQLEDELKTKNQETENLKLEQEQLKKDLQAKAESERIANSSTLPQQGIIPADSNLGDCSTELGKYNWNKDVAYSVMMVESNNNSQTVNNNPATGDYSIGCFQINLFGANANNRPSEEWLKSAENNVAYAYKMYVTNGNTFCTTSGWYNTCKKLGYN